MLWNGGSLQEKTSYQYKCTWQCFDWNSLLASPSSLITYLRASALIHKLAGLQLFSVFSCDIKSSCLIGPSKNSNTEYMYLTLWLSFRHSCLLFFAKVNRTDLPLFWRSRKGKSLDDIQPLGSLVFSPQTLRLVRSILDLYSQLLVFSLGSQA